MASNALLVLAIIFRADRSMGHMGVIYKLHGQRFGRLTVTGKTANPPKPKKVFWDCVCDCGGSRVVMSSELVSGKVTNCGCENFNALAQDLTGKVFGKLTVKGLQAKSDGTRSGRKWLCSCTCGKERTVSTGHLNSGLIEGCHLCGKAMRQARSAETKLQKAHAQDGKTFGLYTVIRPERHPTTGKLVRLCRHRSGSLHHMSLEYLKVCSGELPRNPKQSRTRRHTRRKKLADKLRKLRNSERGKVYNNLTIARIFRRGKDYWAVCDCECGTTGYKVLLRSLKTENTKGCGCLQHIVPDHLRGENHPWYDHELTDEDRELGRHFPGQDAFRSSIFQRDDYTCQACGVRGGRLAGHHIRPWKYFEADRFKTWNLVTLCKSCHQEFHATFGLRDPEIWRYLGSWVRNKRKETGFVKSES